MTHRCEGQILVRSTMYRLRRALFPQCVTYRDGRYQLTLGNCLWYDSSEFVQLLDEADKTDLAHDKRIQLYERAIALHQGQFLEEVYSEWVTPHREEMEMRFLNALTRLAKLRALDGALQEATDLLRKAVAADPFQEEAHRGIIQYTALMGDRVAALKHYRSYVELLRDELDATPAPNILELADRIAHGRSVPTP
ncbi:MAG TPA: bacterial transcriptional activator domain-containing protein [Chloroflexota bacterium]|nr:bacterial transcriptional activator domain-containing protein [Chloroflexota bacterium]